LAAAAIADPAKPTADAEPAPRRRLGRKKLLVICGVALAVVLSGGGGAAIYLKKKAQQAQAEADENDTSADGAATAGSRNAATQAPPTWLPLDPFIVNLADREADRYAQVGITLELETGASADQIRAYMPAIRNTILLILASKSSKDLLDRAGKEQLADEIVREAVRPMGYQSAAPLPVQDAASAATEATGADAEAKPKKRRAALVQRNLIRRVHFSSFIVQ